MAVRFVSRCTGVRSFVKSRSRTLFLLLAVHTPRVRKLDSLSPRRLQTRVSGDAARAALAVPRRARDEAFEITARRGEACGLAPCRSTGHGAPRTPAVGGSLSCDATPRALWSAPSLHLSLFADGVIRRAGLGGSVEGCRGRPSVTSRVGRRHRWTKCTRGARVRMPP